MVHSYDGVEVVSLSAAKLGKSSDRDSRLKNSGFEGEDTYISPPFVSFWADKTAASAYTSFLRVVRPLRLVAAFAGAYQLIGWPVRAHTPVSAP